MVLACIIAQVADQQLFLTSVGPLSNKSLNLILLVIMLSRCNSKWPWPSGQGSSRSSAGIGGAAEVGDVEGWVHILQTNRKGKAICLATNTTDNGEGAHKAGGEFRGWVGEGQVLSAKQDLVTCAELNISVLAVIVPLLVCLCFLHLCLCSLHDAQAAFCKVTGSGSCNITCG